MFCVNTLFQLAYLKAKSDFIQGLRSTLLLLSIHVETREPVKLQLLAAEEHGQGWSDGLCRWPSVLVPGWSWHAALRKARRS